mmetsp:Transcript_5077/g.10745  ORF Transcript_5077/g.10745 Transcript_5077/m.10745 type:complete len:202 (+) Transcript_5077:44-649(+)
MNKVLTMVSVSFDPNSIWRNSSPRRTSQSLSIHALVFVVGLSISMILESGWFQIKFHSIRQLPNRSLICDFCAATRRSVSCQFRLLRSEFMLPFAWSCALWSLSKPRIMRASKRVFTPTDVRRSSNTNWRSTSDLETSCHSSCVEMPWRCRVCTISGISRSPSQTSDRMSVRDSSTFRVLVPMPFPASEVTWTYSSASHRW